MAATVATWWPVLTPPPKLTVSQWADTNRQLSAEASAEPGKWDTSRAEFQRGIMDAVSDPLIQDIVVMKSAQVGWTEIIGNVVGYFVDQDPAPMLVMQPTLEMGEAWSKDRLAPMIRDTPCLTAKISDSKARDSGNTILHKKFAGGHCTIAGANSPASLASRPIRVVLADEVDRYPASAGAEGDPLSLAFKRTTTFWNRKRLAGSTPTVAGASRIEAAFELSDKRYYFIPCPKCGTKQRLSWSQVKWEKDEAGKHLHETAYYECAAADPETGELCQHHWTDAERWEAVRKGEWRATAPFNGIAGFHIWEAYSSWVKLADTVKAFVDAKGNPETLKTWTNTALGETWQEKGEAPDWQRLYDRRSRELVLEQVPEWAGAITAGIDIQRNRIECDIWAWGPGLESALVDHIVIDGDPAKAEIWEEMDALLGREWETASGRRLRPLRWAIDTGDGYSTTTVYAWARKYPRHVMAIKGTGKFDSSSPVTGPTWVDTTVNGRKLRRGVQLWTIAVSVFKSETYAWLNLDAPVDGQPHPPGYIHLPQGTNETWIKQLVAEQLVRVKSRSGFGRLEWQITSGTRNEAIDMRVYARAAAYAVGIDRWTLRHWARVRGQISEPGATPQAKPAEQPAQPTETPPPQPQQGSDWINGGRSDGGSWL
ncbi:MULTISPECIES: phage terminase large subunit family protein [unclassified Sphingobium]|uniref:phage terminase large subunit family protein n=1 Tax=unclassified Sphingobium TaxID=2611147 RepID=UPI0022242E8A|nr:MULTISPECIES: phage terminase large subunit family protein [unclassified Sphingobium]MCW2412013.1 phage terminase large subunit GpA-like protein [Sphingobium sp. B8D3D]MCW2415689.1 phage terminase large subunit GpA-like protein [Sphingobium sp. B8D3A]